MAEKVDIGKLIDEETEERLAQMQDPNYEWPKKAGKWNWWAMGILVAVSIFLMILCMTGVIQ